MRKLRTLDEFIEGYFRVHPDEIDDYFTEICQDFTKDRDTAALVAGLRVINNFHPLPFPRLDYDDSQPHGN